MCDKYKKCVVFEWVEMEAGNTYFLCKKLATLIKEHFILLNSLFLDFHKLKKPELFCSHWILTNVCIYISAVKRLKYLIALMSLLTRD